MAAGVTLPPRVCIVQPTRAAISETFIAAHAERLPNVAGVLCVERGRAEFNGRPVLSDRYLASFARKCMRKWRGDDWDYDLRLALRRTLRRCQADVTLVEYGPMAVRVMEACRAMGMPLVVHFHGYDASKADVLDTYRRAYRSLFQYAAAVIAVSRAMESQLIALGCPADKLVYGPYGVDARRFQGAEPERNPPTLVAVGRFVEKKAPYLTLAAFAMASAEFPDARLTMIGDGPLASVCRDLAVGWGVATRVAFLGAQSHDRVRTEMLKARAFVQHSVTASTGDSEGTPVAVLEAGAMGLPVIATRHAGIPDVIIDGETGILVNERDVEGMAAAMRLMFERPNFAQSMGLNAAQRIRDDFSIEKSIARLAAVLEDAALRR